MHKARGLVERLRLPSPVPIFRPHCVISADIVCHVFKICPKGECLCRTDDLVLQGNPYPLGELGAFPPFVISKFFVSELITALVDRGPFSPVINQLVSMQRRVYGEVLSNETELVKRHLLLVRL